MQIFPDRSRAALKYSRTPGSGCLQAHAGCTVCTFTCVVTCVPAVIRREILPVPGAWPQLLSGAGCGCSKNIPGKRRSGVAEQQDAWDEGPQHPGPLATALWSPSNRILVL